MARTHAILRWLARLALVAACGCTFGAFGIAFWIDRFGRRERRGKVDALVVLGARIGSKGASPALRARVERAVALYGEGLAPRIIFSGGLGEYPPAESTAARAIAEQLGVPLEACVEEPRSRSTAENAREVAALMRRRGWRRALVVSDGFHLLRARQLFRGEGMEVLCAPSRLEGRDFGLWQRLYWTSREALALLLRPRLLLCRAPRSD